MSLSLDGSSGFSMPLGASLYPAPPYEFRGARQAFATYEADAEAVARLLPPGLEADADPPVCQAWVCDYPRSSFGAWIMTFTLSLDRIADGAEVESLPVLSFRHLPPSEEGCPPAASELVRLDLDGTLHELWAGRASVAMDSPSEVDPWHLLAPRRMLGGFLQTVDFTLPLGVVAKDYVRERAPLSDAVRR